VRLSAHLLASDIAEADRLSLSRDIEDLSAQAGALLAQARPLLAGSTLTRLPVSPAEVLTALGRALAERRTGEAKLSIAKGLNLPDVRVDSDALYHTLLLLVRGSLDAAAPGGRVRVSGKHQGRRVILSVSDDGRPLDLEQVRRGPAPRGRELTVCIADAVLRLMGGRAAAEPKKRGSRIDLFLPALAVKKS
jgi:signal transduction histidine kinase